MLLMHPLPTQISGALFLGRRRTALLADAPRVGKTGAALIGADYILASSILIVTTASGRAVWRRAVKQWLLPGRAPDDVVVIGWPDLQNPAKRAALMRRRWDLLIGDEAHNTKSFDAQRTRSFYGELELEGSILSQHSALTAYADVVWILSGTPLPNSPADAYPFMRALCPERLSRTHGPFDVLCYPDFLKRYCETRPKKISRWRSITVITDGKNEDELGRRLDGFMLRRTQQDIGISQPVFDLMPLEVSARVRRQVEEGLDTKLILDAAESGSTRDLEMHLGPLRRLTGEIKARAAVEAVKDELDGGLDKIVLFAWHTAALDILEQGLAGYGVVRLDGSTAPADRATAEERFRGSPRVFVGQIQAAGEAIDLSASAELWFVESSFTPMHMSQAALRITNITQTRQPIVKVCMIEGSIDEALQTVLLRKVSSIREVLANATN